MRRFARRHVPDARDARYAMHAAKSSRRRRFWNAAWCGDQGDTPHCVGYAWAHWLAVPPRPAYLNADGIYDLCLFLDEWPGEKDEGTSVRAGAKLAQRVGLLAAYHWARSKDALVYTLLEEGPVVAGTWWYAGMMRPNGDQVIGVAGEAVGGHAYLVDGINLASGLARIKCAWWDDGEPWGKNGRVWLPIDDLWKLIADDGEACLGIKSNVRKVNR